jgi:type II secretion system protein N
MKRLAIFGVLLAVFLLWTFPHKAVVERMLAKQLSKSEIDVRVAGARPSLWPLGYRLRDVRFSRGEYAMAFDSIGIGMGLFGDLSVNAEACGGTMSGSDREADDVRIVQLDFFGIDPGSCLELGGIDVAGTFDGTFELSGLGRGKPNSVVGRVARAGLLQISGSDGTISGHLPAPPPAKSGGKPKTPQPIGEWQFARLALNAVANDGEITVQSGSAEAEGVEWVLSRGRIASSQNGAVTITAELKARRVDDSPRSKAVLGLLPRATEKDDGWRTYKINGPVSQPQILGLR